MGKQQILVGHSGYLSTAREIGLEEEISKGLQRQTATSNPGNLSNLLIETGFWANSIKYPGG